MSNKSSIINLHTKLILLLFLIFFSEFSLANGNMLLDNKQNLQYSSGDLIATKLSTILAAKDLSKVVAQITRDSFPSNSPFIQTNISYLKNNPSLFGNINTFKTAESVEVYNLTYALSDNLVSNWESQFSLRIRPASGAALVPQNHSNIKGIILYYHPTEISKTGGNIPTNPNSLDMQVNAAIFAAHGYIVIMPDYPGQGIDINQPHPYVLYPQANAISGIEMLNASKTFLAQLGINLPLDLYINSYSEGGAYALWASHLLQTGRYAQHLDGLALKKTIGISGAYDLELTMKQEFNNSLNYFPYQKKRNPYMMSPGGDVKAISAPIFASLILGYPNLYNTISKPVFISYALQAYLAYDLKAKNNDIFNTNFKNMDSCSALSINYNLFDPANLFLNSVPINCSINGTTYTIPSLFSAFSPKNLSDTNILISILYSAIGATDYGKLTGKAISLNNTNNPYDSLLFKLNNQASYIKSSLVKDPEFIAKLNTASIDNWTTISPITLISLKYDSIVSPLNSDNAYNNISSQSKLGLVKRIIIDNTQLAAYPIIYQLLGIPVDVLQIFSVYADHGNSEGYALLAAYNEIDKNFFLKQKVIIK